MVIKPEAIYELAPDGRVMLEMQEFMDMVADVTRLEWLAKSGAKVDRRTEHSGYIVTSPCHELLGKQDHDDWRDAIDEAMESEL